MSKLLFFVFRVRFWFLCYRYRRQWAKLARRVEAESVSLPSPESLPHRLLAEQWFPADKLRCGCAFCSKVGMIVCDGRYPYVFSGGSHN